MPIKSLLMVAATALVLVSLLRTSHAQSPAPTRAITVQGIGTASARPDMAVVRAGVESRAATPDEALAANTKAMTALGAVLQRFAIADRDMETVSLHVTPLHAQQPGPRNVTTIEGYQVSNELSVRMRDLGNLGSLLSALVEGGANRLHGVSFQIAEPAVVREAARRGAMRDARARAELYAAAAGVRLGRVLSINEGGTSPPVPLYAQAMRAAADAVPVAPGEQTMSASVTVVYEIE